MFLVSIMRKARQLATYLGSHCYSIIRAVSVFCLLAMVLIVSADIIGRYVLNRPLPKGIADQFGAYLLVWMGYLALAFTQKTGGHIRVEIVTDLLPQRVRELLDVAVYILIIPVWAVITWKTATLVLNSIERHTHAYETIDIVLWLVQIAMPIGGVVLLIVLISELLEKIRLVRSGKHQAQKGE